MQAAIAKEKKWLNEEISWKTVDYIVINCSYCKTECIPSICACWSLLLLNKYFEIKSGDPTDVRADMHVERMFFALRGYV